jgi:hypothetical protein
MNTKKQFLYYHGTNVEIRLGDKILWCTLFRKRPGCVVYVPGQSLVNPSLESDGFVNWAIQLDSQPHDIITMLYWPDGGEVVPKKAKFLERGEPSSQITDTDKIL